MRRATSLGHEGWTIEGAIKTVGRRDPNVRVLAFACLVLSLSFFGASRITLRRETFQEVVSMGDAPLRDLLRVPGRP
jgi:hypothetical protein